MHLLKTMQEQFGFEAFRPGQEEAIRRVMDGQSLLVVMPTGSGKSLCYQLPAGLLPGVTLVVSPLIALMKDQVDALVGRQAVSATYINSSLDLGEQRRRLTGIRRREFRLVYVAPERFRIGSFTGLLGDVDVSLLVVDEAHCISEWGHDFRPDYLHIRHVLPQIAHPPVLALTATATPRVQADIIEQLGAPGMERLVTGFDRPNLRFEVCYARNDEAKLELLRTILSDVAGKGIIYVGTRRDAENVAEAAADATGEAVAFYHGGMPAHERTRMQEAFMADRVRIMTATNAFGMGIDKADIRFIIHYNMPGSVEAYYQEAGRAGRDGKRARCTLLYAPDDRALQEYFIRTAFTTPGDLHAVFAAIQQHAHGCPSVVVSSDEIEATLGMDGSRVRVAIHELDRMGVIRRDTDAPEGMQLAILADHISNDTLKESVRVSEQRREDRERKLGAIVRYSESNRCRRQMLLSYFGDPTKLEPSERCCDNCAAQLAPTAPAGADATDESSLVAHAILRAADAFEWGLGRGKLAGLLAGSQAKWVEQRHYDRSAHYAALDRFRASQVAECIDALVEQRLLKAVGGQFPVLALTPQGHRCVADELPVALPLAKRAAPPRGPRRERGDSRRQTLELFEQGLAPDDVALRRELSVRTIYTHLAECIEHGELGVDRVVARDVRKRIEAAAEAVGINALTPIKARLPREISYGDIACVVAHLKARRPRSPDERPRSEPPPPKAHSKRLFGEWTAGYALDFTSRFEGAVHKRTEVGELIYQFKYRGRRELASDFAHRLAKLLEELPEFAQADLLVPIPSTEGNRVFQPVAELAARLAEITRMTIASDILLRAMPRPPQKEMEGEAQKKANVRGVFRIPAPRRVRGKAVLLLDDFYDSGATLNAAAQALAYAGAAKVFVLTLGKTIHH